MNLRQNARAAGIYAGARFASYGINLLVLPVLTRLLSPSDFGVIALAGLFPVVAVSVFTCGLGAAAQRYYFEYRQDGQKLADFHITCQSLLFASLLISGLAVWPIQGLLARGIMSDAAYGRALYWAFIAGYMSQIVNFYTIQWQNMERPGLAAGVPFAQAALTSILGLAFVWAGKLGYMGVIYGSLLSSALVCFAAACHFNRGISGRFDLAILKENAVYGLQIVPKSFSGFINRFFDKFMLNNMLSLGAVGIYNIGQSLGNCMFVLMNTVWSAFQPSCYREVFDNGPEGARAAGRLFTIFAYFALLPVLGGILFAQEVVMVIAPPPYHLAIDALVVILAGMAAQTFGMFCGLQFAYAKKAYWIFPLTVAGTLANVAANIILIPRFGLLGAAASYSMMLLVQNAMAAGVGQRVCPIEYQWPRLLLMHGTVILAAGFVVLCRKGESPWTTTYLGKIGFLAVYTAAGVHSRVITRERIARLARTWQRG